MSSINDVIDAISSTITAATGWQCTQNWDSPNPPCVLLYLDSVGEGDSYYATFGGGRVQLDIVANVLVSSTNNVGQSRKLNDAISWFGPSSIPHAILSNPTLGSDPDEATGGATALMTAHVLPIGPGDVSPTTTFDGQRVIQGNLRIRVLTPGDR